MHKPIFDGLFFRVHLMKIIILFFTALISSLSIAEESKPRLIAIDGAITEIIYQLNAADNLVAVDSTSKHPKAATQLPNVGYMRALSAEGILSLKPTQIITTSAAGPKPVIEQLKQSGVDIAVIDQPYTVEGTQQKIAALGQLLNREQEAQALIQTMQKAIDKSLANVPTNKEPLTALFFLGMRGNQLMAAGQGTQADAMLAITGIKNAGDSFNSYKPLSKEAVLNINPDIIIISQHNAFDLDVKNQFSFTSAFKNDRILVGKSEDLLGFGPRLAQGIELIINTAY